MAKIIEITPPVNDGEREVLARLREDLPDDWTVVSNFEIPSGARMLECDAVAFSPAGWAYLIETKALVGQIEGNEREWSMPSLLGGGRYYVSNPLHVLRRKTKKLASMLRAKDAGLGDIRMFPLVVVVTDVPPRLNGPSANAVVMASEVCDRLIPDPRSGEPDVSENVIELAVEVLTEHAQRLSPKNRIGAWELLDLIDESDQWEIWSARNTTIGDAAPRVRLKRFRLDTLAVGEEREAQALLARRDMDALIRLAGADGAVPMLSTVEELEDGIAVVTEWPSGPSIASLLDADDLTTEEREDLAEAFLAALQSVHAEGIVHRALTPACAHVLGAGRVVLTDFDFARVPGTASITQYLPAGTASDYVAPEVLLDPANASLSSDVWSATRIVLAIFGVWHDSTAHWDDLPPRWRAPLEQGLSPTATDRWPDARVLVQRLRSGPDTAPAIREGFLPNDVLDNRWVVRTPAKHGGIADVYRVHDTELETDYAAKFIQAKFKDQDLGAINIADEYKRVADVPPHRNIALPRFVHKLSSYRRGRTTYEMPTRCLLTAWIEGESLLETLSAERLPLARAIEITRKLADALEHLHGHGDGLIHRDVKPANVIVDSQGEPVLVDFNISARVADAHATIVGTPDYMPPDLATTGWTPAADTYMLALTTCEMLAGRPLGRDGVQEWLPTIAPEVREVLKRATAPSGPRIEKPSSFADELAAAGKVILRQQPTRPDPPSRERAHENHNPYRDELNRLFSQSRESNAGTRGLDEFARWTYLSTRIDDELTQAIISGRHRLVLITGNAGDGKTAFIQTLENALVALGGTSTTRAAGNGATIVLDGQRFETNWDGSQDEGDASNEGVLEDFFSPYVGDDPQPSPGETRLIAINEGRLLDFIADEDRAARWGALSTVLRRFLAGEPTSTDDWLLLVNLNLRALTLPDTGDSDIVGATLDGFADPRLWDPCRSCRVHDECYARANASQLRDPVLGPRARERVRQALDIVRLRRRIHITMRDLRSALAFIVVGNRSCDEIAELVDMGAYAELAAGRLANSLFGASPDVATLGDATATRDRLLTAVAALDVARTADPAEDARLWALGTRALPSTMSESDAPERAMLDELHQASRAGMEDPGATRRMISFVHGALRRTQFLERESSSWRRMFPYKRLSEFEELLTATDSSARDAVVRAISYSEGLFNDRFDGLLAVSLAPEAEGVDRSYVTHPTDAFRLHVQDHSDIAQYMEYAPDTLLLRFEGDQSIALELDLDLYETLGRILDGFVPSREELRGTWLNLRVFKDQLAALPTDTLLLSRDDREFLEIRAEEAGEILEMGPIT